MICKSRQGQGWLLLDDERPRDATALRIDRRLPFGLFLHRLFYCAYCCLSLALLSHLFCLISRLAFIIGS